MTEALTRLNKWLQTKPERTATVTPDEESLFTDPYQQWTCNLIEKDQNVASNTNQNPTDAINDAINTATHHNPSKDLK
jgi:IMP cyclohydrolase